MLHDIEKGNHDDKECEEYCRKYKARFGQELPDCQFKGNKSKIQNLIRKVKIDLDGNVTEVQFENETSNDEDFKYATTENQKTNLSKVKQDASIEQNDLTNSKEKDVNLKEKTSLRTKMKNLFLRK